MKLTNDFYLNEFRPKGAPSSWVPVSEYQRFLLKILTHELQVLRNDLQNPIVINSGVRTISDKLRLEKKGFFPSQTSDHYCGEVITTPRAGRKTRFFGDQWFFSVGAVDISTPGMDLEFVFRRIQHLQSRKKIRFGQVIIEESKNSKWIHLSNSVENVIVHLMENNMIHPSGQFMESRDGGKTYKFI